MKEFSTFADGYDCSDCQSSEKEIRKLKSKIEKLQKAYEVLRGALTEMRKYSKHNLSCDVFSMKAECSCGFLEVANEYKSLTEAEEMLK